MNKINIWPFGEHKTITSMVGDRTYTLNGEEVTDFHKGWDISLPVGSKLWTPEAGVITTGYADDLGHFAVLRGELYRWNFWHLASEPFTIEKPPAGWFFAYSGNSGQSTGPHCHIQMTKAGEPSKTFTDPLHVFTPEILDSLVYPIDEAPIILDYGNGSNEEIFNKLNAAKALIEDVKELVAKR